MSDNAESPTETQKGDPSTIQQPTEDSGTTDEKKKIDVLLKAVGDTPIMKTKKWSVEKGRTVQSLSQFISRFLKMEANEQLFIYVNQSFSPSPDQEVGVLFEIEIPTVLAEIEERQIVGARAWNLAARGDVAKVMYDPDTHNCFGSDGKLVLHYCKSQAWG